MSDIKKDAQERMKKAVENLSIAFNRIRTGRAHPSLLEGLMVHYYGSDMPLSQVANIGMLDARTLSISPWEKKLVPEIEKAIMRSDLGLNPSTSGDLIRVPMPALTEETRKGFIKQAKSEAEHARVSVRNIRRDANAAFKDQLKNKLISEDDERKGQDDIQKLTDKFIADIEAALGVKEKDLMEI